MAIIRNVGNVSTENKAPEVRPRVLTLAPRIETVVVNDEALGSVKVQRRTLQVIKNRNALVPQGGRGRKVRNRGLDVVSLAALATEIPLDELVPTLEVLLQRAKELQDEGEIVDYRTNS